MFTFLEVGQRVWLVFLLVVWGGLLFGGYAAGRESTTHRIPAWMRMGSSLCLTMAGWSWFLFCRHIGEVRLLALALAAGMTLGLLGDLFMAGWFPRGRQVIGGIIAFGAGHIFYIAGIVNFGRLIAPANRAAQWTALWLWLLTGLIGWYIVVFRGQKPSLLHWAALPYALLLAGTAGVATGLAIQFAPFTATAAGAALFLFSDLILAAQLFNGLSFRSIGDLIWLTYGPGQMLIVYSIGLAHLVADG